MVWRIRGQHLEPPANIPHTICPAQPGVTKPPPLPPGGLPNSPPHARECMHACLHTGLYSSIWRGQADAAPSCPVSPASSAHHVQTDDTSMSTPIFTPTALFDCLSIASAVCLCSCRLWSPAWLLHRSLRVFCSLLFLSVQLFIEASRICCKSNACSTRHPMTDAQCRA